MMAESNTQVPIVLIVQWFIQFCMGVPFLNDLDLSLLDETEYCQIVLDISDFDVSTLVGLNAYFSKQATDCERIIELRELQTLNNEQLCLQSLKDQLIKELKIQG